MEGQKKRKKKMGELMAFYTVHFDIEENEKEIFKNMENQLKEFKNRFNFFKAAFPRLNKEEKAAGIESFMFLHLFIYSSIHSLWNNFEQTNEWKTLLYKANSRRSPIYELMRTCPLEEILYIARRLIEGKNELIDDVFNQ